MPDFTELEEQDRATITIHAPWWSNERDMLGQWQERVVVRVPVMQADIDEALEEINMERITKMSDLFGMIAEFRQVLYARIFVEVTNSEGKRQPLTPQDIKFSAKDRAFIDKELEPHLQGVVNKL